MATRTHRINAYGDSSRYYEINGEQFPSVTTILSSLGANKNALINWAASKEREMVLAVAAEIYAGLPTDKKVMSATFIKRTREALGRERAHKKEKDRAAEIGSQCHAMIEWNMRRECGMDRDTFAPTMSTAAMVAFGRYEEWRHGAGLRPQAVEITVFSERHKYAGTADWIGKVKGEDGTRCLALGDWKTGKAIYEAALLQNAAYVHAAREMGYRDIACGCVVRLPKLESDPGFEVKWIPAERQDELFEVFLAAKRVWDWTEAVKAEQAGAGVALGGPDGATQTVNGGREDGGT